MPPSAIPNQFSRGIVDKTLYVSITRNEFELAALRMRHPTTSAGSGLASERPLFVVAWVSG